MSKKTLIIFIIIAVVAILGFIFLFSNKKEKSADTQIVKEFPTQQPQTTTIKQEKVSSQPQLIQGIMPYSEQAGGFETFKKSSPLFEDVEEIVSVFTNPEALQTSEINPIPQSQDDSVDPALIEKQVFEILFPDYVIAFYTDLQQSYIDDGYLDENYQKIENFDTDEKVFIFINTSINVAEDQGFISGLDAIKFRIAAKQGWKSIIEEEKMKLRKKLIGSEFYKRIFANRLYHLRKSTNKKVVNFFELMKKLNAKKVYAADCYRSGAATPGGSNSGGVWCCNCGINCYGDYCVFVDDCGTLCNYINYGCKNGVGGGFRPVIWDPATLVCGVG